MIIILNFIIDTIATMCDPLILIGSLLIGAVNKNIRNTLIFSSVFGIIIAIISDILSSDLQQTQGFYYSFVQITTCILLSSSTYGVKNKFLTMKKSLSLIFLTSILLISCSTHSFAQNKTKSSNNLSLEARVKWLENRELAESRKKAQDDIQSLFDKNSSKSPEKRIEKLENRVKELEYQVEVLKQNLHIYNY